MSTWWKYLVALGLVVPIAAYVAGSLMASADSQRPRETIVIEDRSGDPGRPWRISDDAKRDENDKGRVEDGDDGRDDDGDDDGHDDGHDDDSDDGQDDRADQVTDGGGGQPAAGTNDSEPAHSGHRRRLSGRWCRNGK